jgi:hypothetical protein
MINIQGDGYVPYIGPVYRGEKDEYTYQNRMNQPDETTDSTCLPEHVAPVTGPRDPYSPEWQRLEMDSCSNQYILGQNALYSNTAFMEQSPQPDFADSYCQPLRVVPMAEEEQEYLASWYYMVAWAKLLYDENYLYRGGLAAAEPFYGPGGHNIDVTGTEMPVPTENFGTTTLNDLAMPHLQFERIMDPSHPFSPRWDFFYNERDAYSPITAPYVGGGADIVDGVRCAGLREDPRIKTDIMTWRRERFHFYIMQRIGFNIACWNSRLCRNFIWIPRECTPNEGCCATDYRRDDRVPTLWCGGEPIDDICETVTRAVTPVNVLKMRSAVPEYFEYAQPRPVPAGLSPPYDFDPADAVSRVPEGYSFYEYFGNHRPYMRCWDTGQECGWEPSWSVMEGLLHDIGASFAIVGAGRENGATGPDQRCLMGGSLGRADQPYPAPITSWAELKLYQARAIRQGVFCIPRHEIIFKEGTSEDFVLHETGGSYQRRVPDTTGSDALPRYKTFSWPYGWRGYVNHPINHPGYPYDEYGFPFFDVDRNSSGPFIAVGLDDAKPGEILIYDPFTVMAGPPRAEGEYDNPEVWRLPYVGYVSETDNFLIRETIRKASVRAILDPELEYVKVFANNHGKHPDVCGNTDDLYMGQEFTMYKGRLPSWAAGRLDALGRHTQLCVDPSLSSCIEPLWDDIRRYDIRWDQRN